MRIAEPTKKHSRSNLNNFKSEICLLIQYSWIINATQSISISFQCDRSVVGLSLFIFCTLFFFFWLLSSIAPPMRLLASTKAGLACWTNPLNLIKENALIDLRTVSNSFVIAIKLRTHSKSIGWVIEIDKMNTKNVWTSTRSNGTQCVLMFVFVFSLLFHTDATSFDRKTSCIVCGASLLLWIAHWLTVQWKYEMMIHFVWKSTFIEIHSHF